MFMQLRLQNLREWLASLLLRFVLWLNRSTVSNKIEHALEQSEAKYRALFEQTQNAIFLFDMNATIVMANQRAAQLLGCMVEEIVGKDNKTFIIPEEYHKTQRILEQLMANEIVPPYERRFQRKDGEIRLMEVTASLIRDVEGKPLYIQSAVRDITEKRKIEQELEWQQHLLQQVVDLNPNHIWIYDEHQRYILVNQALAQPSDSKNIVGKTLAEVLKDPDDVQKFVRQNQIILETNQPIIIPEESVVFADGTIHWLHTTKIPIQSLDGKIYILGVSVDITERKQFEEALRTSKERYKIVTEMMSDYAFSW